MHATFSPERRDLGEERLKQRFSSDEP